MYPAGGIAVPNLFCVLVLQKVIEIFLSNFIL